jgi:hypothetical protein
LWLAINQTRGTIVTIKLIGSQRPRIKYFSKWAHFLHVLVDFSKSLSYVTKCMHPRQWIAFQAYLAHTFNLETQRRVKAKVSTKYLERHTKIHMKQLHAKDGTLAWYYSLDALLYSMIVKKTYHCLKTISFVHVFKFRTVLPLAYSFGCYTYQELA